MKASRTMRNAITLALCTALVMCHGPSGHAEEPSSPPASAAFNDIAGHPAELELSILCALGVFQGSEGRGGPVDPDGLITREQFCKVIVEGFGWGDQAAALSGGPPEFADGTDVAQWARGYVNAAVRQRIIQGYGDNTFRPKRYVSLAEAVTMLIRAVDNHEAQALRSGTWPQNYVSYGIAHGFTGAVDFSDPGDHCTRGDMARMLVSAMQVDPLDTNGQPQPGRAFLSESARLIPDCMLESFDGTTILADQLPEPVMLSENVLVLGASGCDELVGARAMLVLDPEGQVVLVKRNEGWSGLPERAPVPYDKTWSIALPEGTAPGQIDGVVVAADGHLGGFVPIQVDVSDGQLQVTPVERYERASSYTLRVFLSDGRCLSRSFVTELYPTLDTSDGQFIEVAACPDQGFNYPYLLFIPPYLDDGEPHRLLVEPNNTGMPDDELEFHLSSARELIRGHSWMAEELDGPMLVPVFVRPESRWTAYTHALNRETLLIEKGHPLHRIDLQLVAMIEDAKRLLAHNGIQVRDKIFMNGFSASFHFVNRFVIIHPGLVRAVATGGSSLPTWPISEYQGRTLRYPVGIADLEQLTGCEFDPVEYRKVAQLIYWGTADTNDPLPFRDSYEPCDAQLVISICGPTLLDRWLKSQEIYGSLDVSVQFVTYEGVGHRPGDMSDVIRFFWANDNDREGITRIRTSSGSGGG